jgi:hypothetical protein
MNISKGSSMQSVVLGTVSVGLAIWLGGVPGWTTALLNLFQIILGLRPLVKQGRGGSSRMQAVSTRMPSMQKLLYTPDGHWRTLGIGGALSLVHVAMLMVPNAGDDSGKVALTLWALGWFGLLKGAVGARKMPEDRVLRLVNEAAVRASYGFGLSVMTMGALAALWTILRSLLF